MAAASNANSSGNKGFSKKEIAKQKAAKTEGMKKERCLGVFDVIRKCAKKRNAAKNAGEFGVFFYYYF